MVPAQTVDERLIELERAVQRLTSSDTLQRTKLEEGLERLGQRIDDASAQRTERDLPRVGALEERLAKVEGATATHATTLARLSVVVLNGDEQLGLRSLVGLLQSQEGRLTATEETLKAFQEYRREIHLYLRWLTGAVVVGLILILFVVVAYGLRG